jgi:hypothetical protein
MLADVLRTNWFANINMLLWPFVDKIVVIDASARDAGFKKYVAAALASANGPEAIAALIDQRLGTLERARSFVEWDRARTFASDLSMTVQTIVDELDLLKPP